MNLRALLVAGGIALATFPPAYAKDTRPKSTNPNVKRATKKPKKFKPNSTYKAPKKIKMKKQKPAKYGVKNT
jgi:hypothetical protein